MFGFVVGAACLWGLVRVVRGRHGCGGMHGWHGGGCGPGGWDHHGWDARGGWDRGGRGPLWMRGLFARLHTTPEQEQAIREVVEDLRAQGTSLRGELGRARGDLASALRSDSVDETALGEAFARHDEGIETMRKALVGALARLHDVLEPRQRAVLADWLEARAGRGGPFRSHFDDRWGGMA